MREGREACSPVQEGHGVGQSNRRSFGRMRFLVRQRGVFHWGMYQTVRIPRVAAILHQQMPHRCNLISRQLVGCPQRTDFVDKPTTKAALISFAPAVVRIVTRSIYSGLDALRDTPVTVPIT